MKRAVVMASLVAGLSCTREQAAILPPAPDVPWLAGATVADEPHPYDDTAALSVYDHLHALGVRAVALTPAAYLPDLHAPELRWRTWTHIREAVPLLHARGMRVMIKPYLWSHQFYTREAWTGDIAMPDSTAWRAFFDGYDAFILAYAAIAESTHAELLCVGVELPGTFTQTAAWDSLIARVRAVYHGILSYAATGVEEAERTPFWNRLDVIGIDAFVPLTDSLAPSRDELRRGWTRYLPRLDSLAADHHRKILFTEAGYKSSIGTATRPWEWNEFTPHPVDLALQERCYDALADALFEKPWFTGVFWWKYYTTLACGGAGDSDFIPLGKPAEESIARWFARKAATGG